jgi:hypothetical protein
MPRSKASGVSSNAGIFGRRRFRTVALETRFPVGFREGFHKRLAVGRLAFDHKGVVFEHD